jgi:hypothetical protein
VTPQPTWDPQFPSGSGTTRRVWVVSATGGAGATSVGLGIAQQAGDLGLACCLVDYSSDGRASFDASFGNETLSSLRDTLVTGNPQDALVSIDDLRASRNAAVGATTFALLAMPFGGVQTPPTLMAQCLGTAATGQQLVVVDAGLVRPHDPLWPVMCADVRACGWMIVLTRPEHYGVNVTARLLSRLSDADLPENRILAAFNHCWPDGPSVADLQRSLGPCQWLDGIPTDQAIALASSMGRTLPGNTALQPLCAEVVWRITGVSAPQAPKGRRKGLRR